MPSARVCVCVRQRSYEMRFSAVQELLQVAPEMEQQLPIELYARIGANVSAFPGQLQPHVKQQTGRDGQRERKWFLSFRDLIKMSARAWHKNWVMGAKSEPKFCCLTKGKCSSYSVAQQENGKMWAVGRWLPAWSVAGTTPAALRHKAVIKFLDVPSAKLNTQMRRNYETRGRSSDVCWLKNN